MKKILVLLSFLFTTVAIYAQGGSWKIKWNKKTLISTSVENEKANIRKITKTEWKAAGQLEIIYKEEFPDDWHRHFRFVDENDNELFTKDSSTHYKIQLSELRKLFKGKKEIRIYTLVSPTDPNIAIRARRVHILTIKLP